MRLGFLAERAALRRVSRVEQRDALVIWFAERAAPRIRRGLPAGTDDGETRRLARLRARSFFDGLASNFEEPTLADLRRVKDRMGRWLGELAGSGDLATWARILVR